MSDTSGILVPAGRAPGEYFDSIRDGIRFAACPPLRVTVPVVGEDFPEHLRGTTITAWVLAGADGYWLAWRPESDEFYCFWGTEPAQLGAHRVAAPPLAAWWH